MALQLEANDVAGLRTCKNIRICEVQAGGPLNLGCVPKDCENHILKRMRLRLGVGDAEAIRLMLLDIQLKEPSFFHLMDIDDPGTLRNVLWIHPRSIAVYQEFHDVVSFDTTYRVNRYNMSFASVVGVNHHGQSILLGCALVSHEDADSFRWLFKNWLAAMNNIHPTAIVTDQCQSIRIAIRELMPQTIHHLCMWHILSKLPEKLGRLAKYKQCTRELKQIVYESLDIQSFEARWAAFLETYNLANNKWLKDLYNERQNWVPVYLHHTFWAGMRSTQRSEGMHAYFDELLHSRITLKQFMEQYDMAVGKKIYKEFRADFDSKNKVVKCISDFFWETQYQEAYTIAIFKKIQVELKRTFYCHVQPPTVEETANNVGPIKVLRVLERNISNHYHREYTYKVTWRPNGSYINCQCRKFEFNGILCSHIMTVLAHENIRNVHPRYVLDRWKKTLDRPSSKIFVGCGYPHMTEEYQKHAEVDKYFQGCMDSAVGSDEKLAYIKKTCLEMKNALSSWSNSAPSDRQQNPHNNVGQSRPLREPPVITQRGDLAKRANSFQPEKPVQDDVELRVGMGGWPQMHLLVELVEWEALAHNTRGPSATKSSAVSVDR